MTRHTGWTRLRLGTPAAAQYAPAARKLMGRVMRRVELGGLSQCEQFRTLADGTVLRARFDGTTPYVDIQPAAAEPPVDVDVEVRVVAWVPIGFVVYPAADDARRGWGYPLVGVDNETRYEAANLSPPVTPSAWTLDGGLGEVLLTRTVGAGFPPRTQNPLPLFFEDADVPTRFFVDAYGRLLRRGSTAPPALPQGAWQAYRMQFDDMLDRQTMQPDLLLREFWETIADGGDFLLPLRGYYDRADRSARYVTGSDFGASTTIVDAALNSAPNGYQQSNQRARKDGRIEKDGEAITRLNASIEDVSAELAAAVNLGSYDADRTELRLALGDAGRVLAAQQRAQWIACGARRWYPPSGLGLPILSWDGTPFTNWPARLVAGFISGGLPIDLETFTGPFHGQTKPLFSKRLYAWGRVIGQLPDTVLAAGIQLTETGYRILVLTYRNTDQPGPARPWLGQANPIFNLLARVKVWFIDVTRNEGLTVLLRDARVGAYDGTTNPLGWHYAGMLEMAPPDQMTPTQQAFGAQQAPVFDQSAGRIVMMYFRELAFVAFPVITETELVAIGDGVLTTNRVLWGGPGDERNLADLNPEGVVPDNAYGAEPAPAGSTYPISMVYEVDNLFNPVEGVAETLVIRQNNYSTGSANFEPTDVRVFGRFEQYIVHAYTMDVNRGTIFGLNHVFGSGFQMVWVTEGSVLQNRIFTDPYGIPQINDVPGQQRQSTSIVQPSYARRDGQTILGFDIAPQPPTWPVPALAFVGSYYESSIGDLTDLTQTPNDKPGFYPVGVV